MEQIQPTFSGLPGNQKAQSSNYRCLECGRTNNLKPREPIRCFDCGYRILVKERTKRMVQFEAR
ncbi:DNA-directed RNA polymerase core subunit rpc10 [Coemansia sp. RSA 2706]|nr:DNA-directed RNA polymerase core subunit rpc10 [Coemansia sp. RSA 2706]KAJ2305539.1 DNA-directed RNA polymerase core subunit rpc10 [Coemansia sp. RSA 2704]KAJ2314387.1 DNA-directed RNA polymerase core subunit rpc10 [Coemansia sp. RSA 2705]KAJ2711846.1 DNA-directed RNA polymerase core subunit rpc10 [Coemansia sp. Cherry 401B]